VRKITVLLAYVLLHGGRSEYGLWLPHISLGLGRTNNDSDAVEGSPPLGEWRHQTQSTADAVACTSS
jgi:hypothetical protein